MKTAFNRRTVILAAALGAGTTCCKPAGAAMTNPSATSLSWRKAPPN
jgi:hypothetical protein